MSKYCYGLVLLILFNVNFAFGADVDCRSPMTQVDMNHCAALDYKYADEDLNYDYKLAKRYLKQVDADLPKASRGAAKALLKGQRAWITYRDNACLAEAYLNFGGSIQPLIELSCKARLSRVRSEDLRRIFEEN